MNVYYVSVWPPSVTSQESVSRRINVPYKLCIAGTCEPSSSKHLPLRGKSPAASLTVSASERSRRIRPSFIASSLLPSYHIHQIHSSLRSQPSLPITEPPILSFTMSSTTIPTPKTNIKIVFGCMTIGAAGAEQARVHDLSDCRAIFDIFASHGHTELDTARMYGHGSSEEYLCQLGYTVPSPSHNFQIATKCYPSARNPKFPSKASYTFSAADIARSINDSLTALGTDSFDLFYLHSPDRQTPLEETLSAVNEAYKAGKFKRFGLSNY